MDWVPFDSDEHTPYPTDHYPKPDEAGLRDTERFFWDLATNLFSKERWSYKKMRSLQSPSFLQCYGVGRIDLTSWGRPRLKPYVLFLEYIPNACTLKQLKDTLTIDPASLSVLTTVAKDAARLYPELGIMHNDSDNHGNTLFTPAGCPTRAILIDFGMARMKETTGPEGLALFYNTLDSTQRGLLKIFEVDIPGFEISRRCQFFCVSYLI